MSLKEKLAEFGFESNESFDHVVQCFLESPNKAIRCLNIDGDTGRHKTAFAYALAHALGHPHVLYYEFGIDEPAQPQLIRVVEGEEVEAEAPVSPLDKLLNEACALSEAEKTVLILDQLQLADFKQHLRLLDFSKSSVWCYGDVSCYANRDNLTIYMVSDGGLSPVLQQISFRLWLPVKDKPIDHLQAEELGLSESCNAWLPQLVTLMQKLDVSPTMSEYAALAYDVECFVCTEQQLRESIMGRVKSVDYGRLNSEPLKEALSLFMKCYEDSLDIQESIEISGEINS